jgi:hypothetical protein
MLCVQDDLEEIREEMLCVQDDLEEIRGRFLEDLLWRLDVLPVLLSTLHGSKREGWLLHVGMWNLSFMLQRLRILLYACDEAELERTF